MKRVISFFFILVFISCSNDPKEQLQHLSGYWQIEKVEMEKDSVMNYGLSQYIDYIEIEDSVGFRKKLQPKLDGSYIEVSDDAAKIKTELTEDHVILHYSTLYDTWTETVLDADEESLVVLTDDGKKYYYKKYKPLLSE